MSMAWTSWATRVRRSRNGLDNRGVERRIARESEYATTGECVSCEEEGEESKMIERIRAPTREDWKFLMTTRRLL
jgi:hypothetical protein